MRLLLVLVLLAVPSSEGRAAEAWLLSPDPDPPAEALARAAALLSEAGFVPRGGPLSPERLADRLQVVDLPPVRIGSGPPPDPAATLAEAEERLLLLDFEGALARVERLLEHEVVRVPVGPRLLVDALSLEARARLLAQRAGGPDRAGRTLDEVLADLAAVRGDLPLPSGLEPELRDLPDPSGAVRVATVVTGARLDGRWLGRLPLRVPAGRHLLQVEEGGGAWVHLAGVPVLIAEPGPPLPDRLEAAARAALEGGAAPLLAVVGALLEAPVAVMGRGPDGTFLLARPGGAVQPLLRPTPEAQPSGPSAPRWHPPARAGFELGGGPVAGWASASGIVGGAAFELRAWPAGPVAGVLGARALRGVAGTAPGTGNVGVPRWQGELRGGARLGLRPHLAVGADLLGVLASEGATWGGAAVAEWAARADGSTLLRLSIAAERTGAGWVVAFGGAWALRPDAGGQARGGGAGGSRSTSTSTQWRIWSRDLRNLDIQPPRGSGISKTPP